MRSAHKQRRGPLAQGSLAVRATGILLSRFVSGRVVSSQQYTYTYIHQHTTHNTQHTTHDLGNPIFSHAPPRLGSPRLRDPLSPPTGRHFIVPCCLMLHAHGSTAAAAAAPCGDQRTCATRHQCAGGQGAENDVRWGRQRHRSRRQRRPFA